MSKWEAFPKNLKKAEKAARVTAVWQALYSEHLSQGTREEAIKRANAAAARAKEKLKVS